MSNLGRQVEVNWAYPLALSTQDKRVPLSATVAPYSHEITGVDGILHGGCRPLSGFSKVYDLDFWAHEKHNYKSTVTDFFPVNFKVGFETYAYGFVYRAQRPATEIDPTPDRADIFLDFYVGACDEWSKGNVILENVSATDPIDVTVAGRSTFVFIRGQSPVLFFVNPVDDEEDSSSSSEESSEAEDCLAGYELIIEDAPGPGKQPQLSGPVRTLQADADPINWFQTTQPSNGAPGKGTLILTRKLPTVASLMSQGQYISSGTFDPKTLGNRSNPDMRAALVDLMGDYFDCDNFHESSEIFFTSEDSLVSVTNDTDEPLSMNNAITFMGSTPGGRRYPQGPIIDRDMALYTPDTIPADSYVDQTEKIVGYFRIDRTKVDDDKLAFDLYFQEKDSEDGDTDVWQGVVIGAHLRLDAGVYDDHITENTSALGGTYVTFNPSKPFNVIAENLGPSGREGVYYYRITVNISDLFSDEKWVSGSYMYKWAIRPICGSAADMSLESSKVFQFDVAPNYVSFTGDDPIMGHVLSSSEDIIFEDLNKLTAGDYSFAYQLFDSKTGRRSGLSEIVVAKKNQFVNNSNQEVPLYGCLDVVYDHTKYDKAIIWRTVDTAALNLVGNGILSLEKIITLEDYRVLDPDLENFDSDDYSHSFYIYSLKDEVLQFQQPYPSGTPLFDEKLPYGGTAEFYESTLFVSNIRNSPASIANDGNLNEVKRGLGELRWSSLTDYSPELFPPTNFFIPPTPTNEIIGITSMGGNLIGYSRDRMYFIRKEGGTTGALMRITEVHEGYGVVNPNCASTVGSSSYFLTPRGLKSVDAVGKLDDVGAFDHMVLNEWGDVLSNVSMAYDSASSSLMILSPDKEEIACLWFNSSRATSIKDATFDQCREGVWPEDVKDYSTSLVDRALFMSNSPEPNENIKPRIYVLDYKREKTATVSGTSFPRLTMLDGTGPCIYTVSSVETLSETKTKVTVSGEDVNPDNEWVGGYLYILDSTTASTIGSKAKILEIDGADITLESGAIFKGSDIVGISPVYFRWVGYPIPLQIEGQEFNKQDFHRSKQVDSLGAAFTDVTTNMETAGVSRFRALLFENSLDDLKDSSLAKDDTGTYVDSISDGQSIYWSPFGADTNMDGIFGVVSNNPAPGIDIFVPDLDFRLMSVIVSGKLLPAYRTSMG